VPGVHVGVDIADPMTSPDAAGTRVNGVKTSVPHILVVDDEALIRWSVAETLAARGMRVTQAADGASATHLLESGEETFDVVVLDLRLPDVSDLSLLASVRALSPQSRVIVMTAFGTPDVAVQAMRLGASRIVAKPFEMEEMGALVDAAILADGKGS
jgi:DNA-binding NtrC family response regulator